MQDDEEFKNSGMFVLAVKVKDSERSYKREFLIYERTEVDQNDPEIKKCIDQTLEDFQGEPENIQATIKLQILR